MTKKEKNKSKLKQISLATEKVVPNYVYVKNFAEVTVLSWKVPGYTELHCNVMYNKIFQSKEFRCIFKLLKTTHNLHLCVCSDKICQKVAEFLVVDEADNISLRCLAKEVAEGCYMGEFEHKSFIYPASNYLRNNVLIVSFKYIAYQNLKYSQDILGEANESLANVEELCCDLKKSFLEGLYSDFLIHSSNYTFKAHKFILAAHSKYFDDFFQSNESAAEYTISNDVPPSIIHEILLYMYGGELKESCLEYMLTVSHLALTFKIDTLAHKCSRYFEKCIGEAKRSQIPVTTRSCLIASSRQKEISINCMRIVFEEAFERNMDILANRYAMYLDRRLEKFLYLPAHLLTKEYDEVNLDCIVSLWKLNYERKSKKLKSNCTKSKNNCTGNLESHLEKQKLINKIIKLQNTCTNILERCIDDSLWFDTLVMTGQMMELNIQEVINIYEIAKIRKINVLSSKCIRYLDKHIDVENFTELPAGIAAGEKEINTQCMYRIFKIAWRAKFDSLVNRCFRYFVKFMNNYSNCDTAMLPKDLESLVKVFQLKNKSKTPADTFNDKCILFFTKCTDDFSKMSVKAANLVISSVDYIGKLYRLSRKLNLGNLQNNCINVFRKCLENCRRSSLIRKTLNRNINCVRSIFRLAREFKLVELKNKCAICFEKLMKDCDDLAVGMKTIGSLYKLAHKLKICDVLDKQITHYDCNNIGIATDEEEWESIITLCKITWKLKKYDMTKKCVSILKKRIRKLNIYIQEKYENTSKGTKLKVFSIESVVKVWKLVCKLMRAIYFRRKKQLEQSISKKSKTEALLLKCVYYFEYILYKARELDLPLSEKLKIINCIVDVCYLTRSDFLNCVSQNQSRYSILQLRYQCFDFLATNVPDECYKTITEPSKDLKVEFMVKLFTLACELNTDIEEPMEKVHVSKLISFCNEYFARVRDVDIFDVPAAIQNRNVDSIMKIIDSERNMNTVQLQNEFSKYLCNCILPQTASATSVERKEIMNFENVLKICEFAYTIKKEFLQNDCIWFIQYLVNENNWREIYELAAKINSVSLKNIVINYVITNGKMEEYTEWKRERRV